MKLIAIDGDLSATGMSDKAVIIDVTSAQAKLVFDWQEVIKEVQEIFDECDPKDIKEKLTNIRNKQKLLEQKLKSVFSNKYCYRSTWAKV